MKNNLYVATSLELHLFFGRLMKEHALFLRAGFTPANAVFSRQAEFYKNEFAKIKFNMPSNWTKYSKKDMGQLITLLTSEAVDEEQKENIESAIDTSIYDMLVSDTTTGANTNIVLIEQTENQNPELYMKELKKQFESIKEISYKTDEPATVKIAGEEYTCLKTTAEISGIKLEQAYYVKTKDNYMITIIITTTQEGQLNEILSYFE